IVRRRRALREQRIELVKFRLRGVVVPKSSGTLNLPNSRIKCAVGMLWRAEIAQSGLWLGSNSFQQRSRQSRFADARFTGQQYDLTFAGLRLRPAPQQQFEFFFASDEFSQSTSVQSLEPALDGCRSQRSPSLHRPRDALEALCSKVLKFEEPAHELPVALCNHNAVRLRNALQ